MSADTIVRIITDALLMAVLISGPTVLAAMVVGVVVSVLQSATQIQEQTLSSVPKIIAVYAVIAIAGLWMLRQLVLFCMTLLEAIPSVG